MNDDEFLAQSMRYQDGAIKPEFYKTDNVHLSPAGYAAYAAKLKPLLGGK